MVLRHQHPVRLFPRNKTSGELTPPAEQPPTAESGRIEKHEIAVRTCNFCLQTPCISLSAFKPMGCGAARITNHTKHRKNYKWFWRTLKDCGQLSSLLDLVSVNNLPSKPKKKKKSMQSLACEQAPSLLAVYAKLRFLKGVVATRGFF